MSPSESGFIYVNALPAQPPHHGTGPAASRPRIALALGAGYFRGATHVGVIRALEHEGIPIDLVVGTSAGALAGMMYCAGFSTDYMESALRRLRPEDLFSAAVEQDGFTDLAPLRAILDATLGDGRVIESLQKSFACVAADALTGETVVLSQGAVAPAVEASMAIPGLVRPVAHAGRHLVDGSVVAPIPVSAARALGADWVIGVKADVPRHGRHVARHRAESLAHGFDIAVTRLGEFELERADVVIRPDIAGFKPTLEMTGDFVAAGERATAHAAARLRAQLAGIGALQP